MAEKDTGCFDDFSLRVAVIMTEKELKSLRRRQLDRSSSKSTRREGSRSSSRDDKLVSSNRTSGKGMDPDGKHGAFDEDDEDSSLRRERTLSQSSDRDRSSSRERSRSHSNGRGESRQVRSSSSDKRGPERDSSMFPRSRSSSAHELQGTGSLALTPSVRRRRMSEMERTKRSYTKSPNYNIKMKKDKDESDGRKSSVLGSLSAFLEEGKPATPRKSKDEQSVVSSASKIHRRKSRSMPSSSASVFGGQIIGSRDDIRERRRSRSSSQGQLNDTETSEKRKEMSRGRKSRTPSTRTRRAAKEDMAEEKGGTSSVSRPSDEQLVVQSSPSQRQRKVALSTGADVPPGFPSMAVDKKEIEITGHASGPTVLESTTRIKERQQQRGGLVEKGDGSSKSLGALEKKSSIRRKQSLRSGQDLRGTEGGSFNKLTQDLDTTQTEGSGRGNTLSSRLDRLGGRSPGKNRRKGSGSSVMSAPALSDKHKKRSNTRKREQDIPSRTDPKAPLPPSPNIKEVEEDLLEKILGMPKFEKDEPDEQDGGGIEGSYVMEDDLQGSMASLDPSILTKNSEPIKKVNSIHELYYDAGGKDEGIEGELDLNDGSTQTTQESSSDSCRGSQGAPIVLFDSQQIQQRNRQIGPGTLSPHSSSLSGTSDSLRSPGILKRRAGIVPSESPSIQRVSWVELPLSSPGTLLVKSADTDGANERETLACADTVSSLENLDETNLSDALKRNKKMEKEEKKSVSKKSPSLGATLENDRASKKRQTTDERTVGTSATNTSESTAKAGNKSSVKTDNSTAKKLESQKKKLEGKKTDSDSEVPTEATSSNSLESTSMRSTRSSFSSRRGKDESMDGSTSSRSRNVGKKDDDGSARSERKVLKRSASKGNIKKPRSGDVGEEGSENQKAVRRRGSLSAKGKSPRAGSKIKYVKADSDDLDQSSGEPTTEVNTTSISNTDTTPLNKKKSYLNRRQLMKDHKEKSQRAKSSVKNSLDSFLARIGDQEEPVEDNRSINSDGRLKKQRARKKADSDDRSISSAPMLNTRRKRRSSTKVKRSLEASMAW